VNREHKTTMDTNTPPPSGSLHPLVGPRRGRPVGSRNRRCRSYSTAQVPHLGDQVPHLGDQVLHFDHQIYLDAGKHRSVCITAPAAVSLPEMERIKQWVATLFFISSQTLLACAFLWTLNESLKPVCMVSPEKPAGVPPRDAVFILPTGETKPSPRYADD